MTVDVERLPLVLDPAHYLALKDPCPVYDGRRWHLYGTGIIGERRFELLHAVSDELTGPWRIQPPVVVDGISGSCVAAPGVIVDGRDFHMFLQTDFDRFGGRIEHLVSSDGQEFVPADTALTSDPGVGEAGIYDPHPALVDGWPFVVYSAFTTIGEPDLHLARSRSGRWDGPWERLGPILSHDDATACHNARGSDGYEWGLEGAQLVQLPDGGVLLNAVCFVPGGSPGCRQRVFFALADDPLGPYELLGPVLTPLAGDGSGENGHATVVTDGERLVLFFQERDAGSDDWRYGVGDVALDPALLTTTGRAA